MKRKRASSATSPSAAVPTLNPICQLDLLNDDLLVRIFRFVGNGVTCLQTLAPVCKRFRLLMNSPTLWESKIIIGFGPLSKLKPQLLKYPVRSLFIRANPEEWPPFPLKDLFALKCTLRSLEIHCDDSVPISFLIGNLTGLTRLSLASVLYDIDKGPLCRFSVAQTFDFQDALMDLKGLQDLELTEMPIKQKTLQTILSQCPLQSFSFICFSKSLPLEYDLKELVLAVSVASRLTRLKLDDNNQNWTHTLETSSSLTSLQHLQSLCVRWSGLTISCFALWVKSLTLLRTCEIWSLVGDGTRDSLTDCSPGIEKLKFSKVERTIVDSVSEWLKGLGSLKRLSVCFLDFLETLDVQQSQLPCLQFLTLQLDKATAHRLTDRALAAIPFLPRLSKLSIHLCYFGGVSFESSDIPVKGFRLLQNLKKIKLQCDDLHEGLPEVPDEKDLELMLACALPCCEVYTRVRLRGD
mmetsp:Transcript_9738/g.15952  ORF Transcript_9738/g.15952 Transcript_9738/m.15952 type:complete len:466 (-) Transcript_9738:127-1524(-)